MIKSAQPIAAKALNEKEFSSKYSKQVRTGKTKKDHAAGAHQARMANRDARVAWQKEPRASNDSFPG